MNSRSIISVNIPHRILPITHVNVLKALRGVVSRLLYYSNSRGHMSSFGQLQLKIPI